MPDVINHTEVYCRDCRTTHPARQLLADGKIIGAVECPVTPWQTTLSEHGQLFLKFRKQAGFDPEFRAPEGRPFFFHYVSITDDCNCACPVCYADSGSTGRNTYLSMEEARAVLEKALAKGARTIVLVGGEPTLHPQLAELICLFSRAKLTVWLATNGLCIAREPGFADRLKRAGLAKVSLQLDSFDRETHRAIRGNEYIEEKLEAARQITAAGLDLGLVCTVTSRNLGELAPFCRRVLAWPTPPRTIIFQGAAHTGRLAIDEERYVSREDIVTSLVDGEALPGLTVDHFWPIPLFRPLDVYVHPDCAANTVAVVTSRGCEPVSAYADMEKFIDLASRSPGSTRSASRSRYLLTLSLQCLRLNGWLLAARHLYGLVSGRGRARVVFIGTGAFLQRDFLDVSRIQRCGSGNLDVNGAESMCACHGKQPCNGI